MSIITRYTVCPRDCYDTCAMEVSYSVEDNDVINIKADANNPITDNFLCPRGVKDHIRRKRGRLTKPLIRDGTKFHPISYEKAYTLIAKKIREITDTHGSNKILYYDYAGNQGVFTTEYPKRIWHALGATLTDWSLCTGAGNTAIKLHLGRPYGLNPIDLPNYKLIVLWGMNVTDNGPHIWHLIRKAQKKGAKVIYIDVRETRTAKLSNKFIRIRPHTDIVLAYSIIHQLIKNNEIDLNFIEKYTIGFEHLKNEAKKWSPLRASEITGIDETTILRLAGEYGRIRPSATMIGVALQKSINGWESVRLLAMLPALLGEHRGFFYSYGSALEIDRDYLSGATFVKKISTIPQVSSAHLLEQGEFKMVFVSSANPAITNPNASAFISGMRRKDVFSVVQDTHLSHTARQADLILPAPNFLEKEDLIIPWGHNFLRYNQRIIHSDIPTEIEQMWAIARKLGLSNNWLFENPRDALVKSISKLFDNPQEIFTDNAKVYTAKTRKADIYQTPSGKLEFYSSAAFSGINPIPEYHKEEIGKDEFFLISSAITKYTNSQFQEVYGDIPVTVHINPQDALVQGVKDGQKIYLYNSQAKVLMEAKLNPQIQSGMLWVARNAMGLNGIPLNSLVNSNPPVIGRGSAYHSTKVKIMPAN